MRKITPMKAIRAKCLDCTCFQPKEVRLCVIEKCPLYPYRMGHKPKEEYNFINEDTYIKKTHVQRQKTKIRAFEKEISKCTK